ncbi:MAG: isoprenylcysteine carboxylmethyltransferase family protein [Alphaproteobacteria bacterium]|nr:isoprenylcysteine carboxylmethyltransferase family protein [Alphaproteobacteria bacterium]
MTDKPICGGVTPPPIIYAVCFLAGLGLDGLWPVPLLPVAVQYSVGVAFMVAGLALFVWALREFTRAQTAVTHHRPTTGIVTTGPFGFSRNPIYVAMTAVYLGAASAVDGVLVLVLVLPAIVAIHTLVIPKEETFLEKTFGDDYRRYKSTVRRWI